jgi:uncharacterized protein (TIGR03663 family)
MKKGAFACFFLAALLAAAIFRLAGLGLRPMHHDEANQALKFGALLEQGEYRYDKTDHHGPSLYYFSLPAAWISSGHTLAGLGEVSLRTVTAVFGLGTLLLFLLFVPLLERRAVAAAALCLATSPAMVYFSRFYIQESLLVFFLTGFMAAVWRYLRRPGPWWAVMVGLFAGLMYATKETAVIASAAAGAALLLAILVPRKGKGRKSLFPKNPPQESGRAGGKNGIDEIGASSANPGRAGRLQNVRWSHLVVAFALALGVSFLLFSSFLQNPGGFWDSILSFKIYFVRAGEGGFHVHPWYYYLQTLALSRPKAGPLWSEGVIVILALAGCAAAWRKRPAGIGDAGFPVFLVGYTLLSTAVYSMIPYKTPWNALPFYLGFILLAGLGLSALLDLTRARPLRLAVIFILAAAFFHLGIQTYRANFVYPADPRNPYVYAQTSPDFLKLVRRVEEIASRHPGHRSILIKVIAGPYETWPLPWYLRSFDRVGYWTGMEDAGDLGSPPLIVTSAEEALKLETALNTIYRSEYYELRPGALLALHVRDDVWESVFIRRPEFGGESRK